jgi:hypothetical protein
VAAGLSEIGPMVLRQQKKLLRRWERMTLDAAVDDSIAEFGAAFQTGEPQQHMNAFLREKAEKHKSLSTRHSAGESGEFVGSRLLTLRPNYRRS